MEYYTKVKMKEPWNSMNDLKKHNDNLMITREWYYILMKL